MTWPCMHIPTASSSPPNGGNRRDSLSLDELHPHIDEFMRQSEFQFQSKRTLDGKKDVYQKMLWFFAERDRSDTFDAKGIRRFLYYVATGHNDPTGRWGNPTQRRPVSPATVKLYRAYLCSLSSYLIGEEVLDRSPLDKIPVPKLPSGQVKPFSPDQIEALFQACRTWISPQRDETLLRFLLDTGCRISEAISITFGDLDFKARSVTVRGKGNKTRTVYFGNETGKFLRLLMKSYVSQEEKAQLKRTYVFMGVSGSGTGKPMTRSGAQQLIEKLGERAQIKGVRCSPHTFRHTFAISFLRKGGNVFALQQLLGHSHITMTQRYCALANTDLQDQHQKFGPGDDYK